MDSKPKIYIVIYTLYHHMYKLATKVAEGAEANGCEVKLFQVEETLSTDILDKMHAPPKPDLPIITAAQLVEADGIIFGLPTRFGTAPAQIKRLLDATGSLWAKGSLSQKFAGFFFSSASSHGGQETTALTTITYLTHHGINYIPFGYANSALFDNSKVVGGGPFGAGTISNGDGTRVPIQEELDMAKNQGENFARVLTTYHRGLRRSVAGLESKPIHANDQTAKTTSTDKAPEVVTGATAGAAAAAAGGAGLVAAGTKAARESDQAANQGVATKSTNGTTTTGDQTAKGAQNGSDVNRATKSEPAVTQAAQSEPATKQGAPPISDPNAKLGTKSEPTTKQNPAAQSGPAAKQGVATQNEPTTKQGAPTSTQKQNAPAQEPVPDSSTQPPNRPLTPQQEQAQAAAAPKEKKKSKSFWFCCGNSKDLD